MRKKYNNNIVTLEDGTIVHSELEAADVIYFRKLLEEGKIQDYRSQVVVELQPEFNYMGKRILPITFVADHYVVDNNDQTYILDTKGFLTEESRLKIKLFKYKYPDIIFKLLKNGEKVEF